MRRVRQSLWTNSVYSLLFSAVIGILLIFISTAVFSALVYYFLEDMHAVKVLSSISLCTGSFCGAYICGKHRRRHGLVEGILCGLIIYAVICTVGIAAAGSISGIKNLLLLALSGAAGGVTGVNSKRPKI